MRPEGANERAQHHAQGTAIQQGQRGTRRADPRTRHSDPRLASSPVRSPAPSLHARRLPGRRERGAQDHRHRLHRDAGVCAARRSGGAASRRRSRVRQRRGRDHEERRVRSVPRCGSHGRVRRHDSWRSGRGDARCGYCGSPKSIPRRSPDCARASQSGDAPFPHAQAAARSAEESRVPRGVSTARAARPVVRRHRPAQPASRARASREGFSGHDHRAGPPRPGVGGGPRAGRPRRGLQELAHEHAGPCAQPQRLLQGRRRRYVLLGLRIQRALGRDRLSGGRDGLEALRRNGDRSVRRRPLHDGKQLPERRKVVRLRSAVERAEVHRQGLFRRRERPRCSGGTAQKVYRIDLQ